MISAMTAVPEEPAIVETTAIPPPPTGERLVALDVFRGMTIGGMLLVNDPGSWSAIYPPLEHAEWHGWTPTDLVFPFFLFTVGVTTDLPPKGPKRIPPPGRPIIPFVPPPLACP